MEDLNWSPVRISGVVFQAGFALWKATTAAFAGPGQSRQQLCPPPVLSSHFLVVCASLEL